MSNWLSAEGINQLLFVIPLVVSISLVYGATRHELLRPILANALRAGWWIVSFMGVIFAVLLLLGWQV